MKWNLVIVSILLLTAGCGQMYHPAPSSSSSSSSSSSHAEPGNPVSQSPAPSAKPSAKQSAKPAQGGDGIESHSSEELSGTYAPDFLCEKLPGDLKTHFLEVEKSLNFPVLSKSYEAVFQRRLLVRILDLYGELATQNSPELWNEVIQQAFDDIQ